MKWNTVKQICQTWTHPKTSCCRDPVVQKYKGFATAMARRYWVVVALLASVLHSSISLLFTGGFARVARPQKTQRHALDAEGLASFASFSVLAGMDWQEGGNPPLISILNIVFLKILEIQLLPFEVATLLGRWPGFFRFFARLSHPTGLGWLAAASSRAWWAWWASEIGGVEVLVWLSKAIYTSSNSWCSRAKRFDVGFPFLRCFLGESGWNCSIELSFVGTMALLTHLLAWSHLVFVLQTFGRRWLERIPWLGNWGLPGHYTLCHWTFCWCLWRICVWCPGGWLFWQCLLNGFLQCLCMDLPESVVSVPKGESINGGCWKTSTLGSFWSFHPRMEPRYRHPSNPFSGRVLGHPTWGDITTRCLCRLVSLCQETHTVLLRVGNYTGPLVQLVRDFRQVSRDFANFSSGFLENSPAADCCNLLIANDCLPEALKCWEKTLQRTRVHLKGVRETPERRLFQCNFAPQIGRRTRKA